MGLYNLHNVMEQRNERDWPVTSKWCQRHR